MQQQTQTVMHTPWGNADHVRVVAEGITEVATPSHGGFHLSPDRVAQMPEGARKRSGWYEEDCEAMWVISTFFDEVKCLFPEASHAKVRASMQRMIHEHYEGDFSRVRMST